MATPLDEFRRITRTLDARFEGKELVLTPDQKKDIETIHKLSANLRKAKQNPWVSGPGLSGTYSVVFKTPNNSSEALFWTGNGFKDLSRARGEPQDFKSKEDAEAAIKHHILAYIRKWRSDQEHLIFGWDK